MSDPFVRALTGDDEQQSDYTHQFTRPVRRS